MVACIECDMLQHVKPLETGESAICKRCGSLLLRKKKESVVRTLAFVITGLLIFFPACFCPVITMKALGEVRVNNMFTGIRELFVSGYPDVAAVVFLFSILIPLLKFTLLLYILLPLSSGRIFPFSHAVFRYYIKLDTWGMLGVYMLGILVALTKLGSIATVEIGVGLYLFIALLVTSVCASSSLDTDSVWKYLEGERVGH